MICDMSVAYGPLPQINTTQKGGSMLSLPLLRPKILPFEECWGGGVKSPVVCLAVLRTQYGIVLG